ncbi:hypothetical protein HMPREF3038_01954 [Akkermansia sp. KLE1797]|nr:hypothetical protein HMPREF3038_01954 [Akkermansia sp. KLE1797]KXU54678.1 hypothetical protein HMPREF3039_01151 [Akkermansia sp. KLE1798]KZA06022.1 hypothetical protein HMPREF1326_00286 [Akkermansia sp. KLE1605]
MGLERICPFRRLYTTQLSTGEFPGFPAFKAISFSQRNIFFHAERFLR